MLIWSRSARWPVWALFAAVFLVIVVAPLAVLVAAALAAEWNDVLPGAFTTAHLGAALTGENQASLLVSLQTAAVAGLAAVAVGTWAALALAVAPRWLRRGADALLHLPVAIPSVVVGLGLLVAYSRPPLLLNGTRWIVLIAHVVLVLAFSYATVSSALTRIDGSYAQVAASLGRGPRWCSGGCACRCCCRPCQPPRHSRSRCRWARSAPRSWCTRRTGARCRSPSSP